MYIILYCIVLYYIMKNVTFRISDIHTNLLYNELKFRAKWYCKHHQLKDVCTKY